MGRFSVNRQLLKKDRFLFFCLVIGNKYGSLQENAVGMGEVADFEKVWNIPVVRVRNQTNSINPGSLPEVSISLHRGRLENIRPLWGRGG